MAATCAFGSREPNALPIQTFQSSACGERRFHDQDNDTLLNPVALLEILSSSTEAYDRGEKFRHYQTIGSFQEYVLVSQDSPRIERYLKQAPNTWLYEALASDSVAFEFASVRAKLLVEEIYEDLESAGA